MDLWPSTQKDFPLLKEDIAIMVSALTGLNVTPGDVEAVTEDGKTHHAIEGLPFSEWAACKVAK
jgi:hypothetical protein